MFSGRNKSTVRSNLLGFYFKWSIQYIGSSTPFTSEPPFKTLTSSIPLPKKPLLTPLSLCRHVPEPSYTLETIYCLLPPDYKPPEGKNQVLNTVPYGSVLAHGGH